MAKQSGKNPDNLVKYMADINASLANVMTAIDDLKERVTQGFAEQDQLRKDNLRSVTARVASIGHEVSYLREAVCSNVTDTVSSRNYNEFNRKFNVKMSLNSAMTSRTRSRTGTGRRGKP